MSFPSKIKQKSCEISILLKCKPYKIEMSRLYAMSWILTGTPLQPYSRQNLSEKTTRRNSHTERTWKKNHTVFQENQISEV